MRGSPSARPPLDTATTLARRLSKSTAPNGQGPVRHHLPDPPGPQLYTAPIQQSQIVHRVTIQQDPNCTKRPNPAGSQLYTEPLFSRAPALHRAPSQHGINCTQTPYRAGRPPTVHIASIATRASTDRPTGRSTLHRRQSQDNAGLAGVHPSVRPSGGQHRTE